jgi:voltage-gated potassium channel
LKLQGIAEAVGGEIIMPTLKERIFGILEPGDEDSKYFDPFIITLIFLNVVAMILESVDEIYIPYSRIFNAFDWFSVSVFTVEYVLRVWSITVIPRFRHPVKGRLRYMATPMAIIDLMAFLPFFLPMFLPDMRYFRSLRLLRLFRLLKMVRYSESVNTFINIIKRRHEELTVSVFVILILLVVASSMMYEAEHDAQPKAFSNIPAAMWWGVVTLATVGYGDMFPITPIGKLIGSVVVILGIGLFALPAGILASGFVEEIQERKKKTMICPHCGMSIEENAFPEEEMAEGGRG